MKKQKSLMKICSYLLAGAMVISGTGISGATYSKAAKGFVKKVTLSKETVKIEKGAKAKIKVTVKVSGKAGKKFTVKSADNSVVKAQIKGKKVVLTGVDDGNTTV
ncbi:MAG: Ig-like domain-containing protein, partial [Lachnospiraceae bacterium]|nr:Ig-like domain-containing protein [Lachnospiraceae bacterium]